MAAVACWGEMTPRKPKTVALRKVRTVLRKCCQSAAMYSAGGHDIREQEGLTGQSS